MADDRPESSSRRPSLRHGCWLLQNSRAQEDSRNEAFSSDTTDLMEMDGRNLDETQSLMFTLQCLRWRTRTSMSAPFVETSKSDPVEPIDCQAYTVMHHSYQSVNYDQNSSGANVRIRLRKTTRRETSSQFPVEHFSDMSLRYCVLHTVRSS